MLECRQSTVKKDRKESLTDVHYINTLLIL